MTVCMSYVTSDLRMTKKSFKNKLLYMQTPFKHNGFKMEKNVTIVDAFGKSLQFILLNRLKSL